MRLSVDSISFGRPRSISSGTGTKLREMGLREPPGCALYGIEAVFRLRESAGLDRDRCLVGAVGASFERGKGIDPGDLAR
jgi:hypothetical protein